MSSIHPVPSTRPDLFAFEINGRIHQSDIEAMADTLQLAFDRLGEVDVLIIMRRWDGIDLSAAFDPKALWAQARANDHIRKYAVVGAPMWASAMINLFAPLTPVTEKTFALDGEAEAWAWVGSSSSEVQPPKTARRA